MRLYRCLDFKHIPSSCLLISHLSPLNGLPQQSHHIFSFTVCGLEAFCPRHEDALDTHTHTIHLSWDIMCTSSGSQGIMWSSEKHSNSSYSELTFCRISRSCLKTNGDLSSAGSERHWLYQRGRKRRKLTASRLVCRQGKEKVKPRGRRVFFIPM